MKNTSAYSRFKAYVEDYKPFPWEVVKDHDNPDFVGSTSLHLSYIRFKLILEAIINYFKNGMSILDVGVYPGILPKIFREFYPGDGKYTYFGCGIGFDGQFIEAMKNLGVTLFETDLDPRLHLQKGRRDDVPLPNEAVDIAFCTDVIEHFYDPFHMLKEVNRVMKAEGILILTTDNVSRWGALRSMLRGQSSYTHILESNIFYEGDWRPHFREYSKEELLALLKYAGFEVIEHKYFESEFGSYKVVNNQLVKIDKKDGISGWAKRLFKSLLFKIQHLKDSHLIICKKVMPYRKMLENSPKITNKLNEWVEQRIKFKNL